MSCEPQPAAPVRPSGRRGGRYRARRALLQAVYAWQLAGDDEAGLVDQFTSSSALEHADGDYFLICLAGVLRQVDELDGLFAPFLDREVGAVDHVERAILRTGTFELKEREEVPARVVINEWVELAKSFGAEQSYRYVNGVLDKVAHALRPGEL